MNIRMHVTQGTLVVRPSGTLTAAAARELHGEIQRELEPGPRDVVLNLSGVDRLDVEALAYLFRIQKHTQQAEARFCVAEASEPALRLFECTHVADNLELVASEEEAMRAPVA